MISHAGTPPQDENFVQKHTGPGFLSMVSAFPGLTLRLLRITYFWEMKANSGPNTNGCQVIVLKTFCHRHRPVLSCLDVTCVVASLYARPSSL